MNVYVAASFAYEDKAKTSQKKDLIEKTVEKIKKHLKANFYLPHQLKIPNAWDISLEEWSRKVYEQDLKALKNADVVLFLSFGKENNAGSVWEVGYTIGRNESTHVNIPVICVSMTSDPESLMFNNSVWAMLKESEIDTYNWSTLPKYKTKLDRLS